MADDPYKPKHSKATVSRYFGKDSIPKDAQKLRVENPSLYHEMRKDAEAIGLVGPCAYFRPEDNPHDKPATPFTPEELKARALYPKDAVDALLKGTGQQAGDSNNAGQLAWLIHQEKEMR